jgi:pilus assembly protein CpaB
MDKYKPLIFLGLAVVIAVVTSLVAHRWLQSKAEAPQVASVETESYLVAVTDLPWGAVLTKEMVKPVRFAKGSVPQENCFRKIEAAEGRVVISPIKAAEPIFRSRLAPETVAEGGVGAVINANKRAMTVKVDKVKGVSGFVHPGNRVDVLVTLTRSGRERQPVTKTVLENIVVLASGTELQQRTNQEKPVEVDVITLEVAPEEAEKLALAANAGTIQLAMRNHTDTQDVLTKGTTIDTLLASYSPVSMVVKEGRKRAARKPQRHRVEVIKGSTVSNIKF